MRTTLNLDDDLLGQAIELTGITELSLLANESLKSLIERETVHNLALEILLDSSKKQLDN